MPEIGFLRLGLLFLLLGAALYTDLVQRRIPNWLTYSAAGLGLGLAGGETLSSAGWEPLIASLSGLFVGAGVFFIPWRLGWLGGGDVKLLAAIGALSGTPLPFFFIIRALFLASLVGGVMALYVLIKNKRLLPGLRRSVALLAHPNQALPEDAETLPYGVAIALGSFGAAVASLLQK